MEFYNQNQKCSYLEIELLEDVNCMDLWYEIDGKSYVLPVSNRGFYAIYLDHFSSCKIQEAPYLNITLKEWNEKKEILNSLKQSLCKNVESDVKLETLYEGLPSEPTEYIYHIFKRLLHITKQSVLQEDRITKQKVLKIIEEQIAKVYTGKENYVGNWWVFEIGIPRALNEILILLYDVIEKDKICLFMAIENFYLPCAEYEYYRRDYPNVHRFRTNFANLADNIYICLLRNILIQNQDQIEHLYSYLPELLTIVEEGNGFYKDGGFLYHTNVPYTASYGEVLLTSITKILEVYYLLDRKCDSYFEYLIKILEKSFMPFLYHHRALNCVRGRASSRTKGDAYSFQVIMDAMHKLSNMFYQQGFLDHIYNEEQFYVYTPASFAFNSMHRYLKRNSEYMVAISSHSNRIANYESINQENLQGYYQANFTYDIYWNTEPKEDDILRINPLYRNGSTNVLMPEEPNQTMENQITAGVAYGEVLNTCFHQNNQVTGYFSKFVLENSLVAVGTNISSKYGYVTTILNFEEPYIVHKNTIEGSFKIIFKGNPVIEEYQEKRSFYDLNRNESDLKRTFQGTRVYYKNPKNYEYQLYPKNKSIKDEYQLTTFEYAHILKYQNYIFINSFEDTLLEFEKLKVKACASMIFVFKEDTVLVRIASSKKDYIKLQIKGYTCYKTDLLEDHSKYLIEDIYEHFMEFRRER